MQRSNGDTPINEGKYKIKKEVGSTSVIIRTVGSIITCVKFAQKCLFQINLEAV
jgi:hypothetical protein